MTKEIQDRTWASLPKEAREEIRLIFLMPSKYDYPQSIRRCLLDIYGDNITSDTEPEEMLMVKRSFLITQYEEAKEREKQEVENGAIEMASQYLGMQRIMNILFGDKCLSDKEQSYVSTPAPTPKYHIGKKIVWLGKERIISAVYPDNPIMYEFEGCTGMLTEEQIDSCNNPNAELEHRLEQTIQESVQVEPKYRFSLGQKVILHFYGGETGTISERLPPQDGIVWNCYKVKEMPNHIWRENELDPYDNPILTYHVGQRVRVIKDTNLAILHKIGTIEEVPVDAHHDMYKVRFANGYAHLEASKLEPFTEPAPKFNAGDKVKIVDKAIVTFGNTATIQGYAGKESENMYWVDDKIGLYSESQIESYTEENKE